MRNAKLFADLTNLHKMETEKLVSEIRALRSEVSGFKREFALLKREVQGLGSLKTASGASTTVGGASSGAKSEGDDKSEVAPPPIADSRDHSEKDPLADEPESEGEDVFLAANTALGSKVGESLHERDGEEDA